MSLISRTSVWLEDREGSTLDLKPISYVKDKASHRILIAEIQTIETDIQIEQHTIVPLLLPDKYDGKELEVHPSKYKQDFDIHGQVIKKEQLSFNVDFSGYRFYVRQSPSILQSVFKYICKWLEELREKNPGFYDVLVNCAAYIWETITVVIGYFTGSTLFLAVSVCILYAIFILFQIGSERNRADRLLKEKEKEYTDKVKRYEADLNEAKDKALQEIRKQEEKYKKQLVDSLVNLVKLEHDAAHNGKICTVDMASLTHIVDSSSRLIELLKKCVNNLEQQLSVFYQCKICASFKMVDVNEQSETVLRTCARGENNIKLRGRIGEVSSFEEPVKISDNTAYTHIFRDNHNCFYNGNLLEYCKRRKKKPFRCEYKNWRDYFVATIVIPIRWHVSNKEAYDIAALVCVDCKEPLNDWDNRDSFGYHLVAFYADLLYTPLRDYVKYRRREYDD